MSFDQAQLENARALAQAGRYDEALSAFESLHQSAPDDANIAFMLGACYFKKGAVEDARRVWTGIVESFPDHEQAKSWLGKLPPPPNALSPWESSSAGSAPAAGQKEPALSETARKPKIPARKERDLGWLKWAAVAVVVLGVGGLAADMFLNPQSYPFLGADKPSAPTESAGQPQGVEIPAEQEEPLEPTLPGRWVFTWENDPATVTFSTDGKVSVMITREANIRIDFQGTWKIEGTTILLENLASANPAVGEIGTARLLNAKIVRSQLLFNLNDPSGPEISAIKQ